MEKFDNANGQENSAQTTEQSQSEAYYYSLTNQAVLPNGNKMDLKELVNGYMRQDDYTKKRQADAKDKAEVVLKK